MAVALALRPVWHSTTSAGSRFRSKRMYWNASLSSSSSSSSSCKQEKEEEEQSLFRKNVGSPDEEGGMLMLYKYLERKGELIEVELAKALMNLLRCGCPKKLEEAIHYSTKADGGRHLSTLCIAACEIVGGSGECALPMAVSIELWMAVVLTLDDLPSIDNAAMRKGRPCTHLQFGEPAALLATHSLHSLAFENIIACDIYSHHLQRKLVAELCGASQQLVWGQLQDVDLSTQMQVDVCQLDTKSKNKTCSFFQLALVTGAILGDASPQQIECLRRFAHFFGLMWQVNDDMSDATMSCQEMGKDANSDSRNSKATYMTLLGARKGAQYRDQLAAKAKQELLSTFPLHDVGPLVAIVEATRRFGSIYNNSQLLHKLQQIQQRN